VEEVSGRVEVGTSPKEEERGKKWDTPKGVQLHVLLLLGSVVVHKTRQMANNCHPPFAYSKGWKKEIKVSSSCVLPFFSLRVFLKEKAMDPTNTLHNLPNKLYLSFDK